MGQRAAGLKKLADAAGPLYKSLDDGQKHRFAMLARLDGGQMRGHHGWQHHRGHRGGMMDNDGGRCSAVKREADGGQRDLPDARRRPRKPPASTGGFSLPLVRR